MNDSINPPLDSWSRSGFGKDVIIKTESGLFKGTSVRYTVTSLDSLRFEAGMFPADQMTLGWCPGSRSSRTEPMR